MSKWVDIFRGMVWDVSFRLYNTKFASGNWKQDEKSDTHKVISFNECSNVTECGEDRRRASLVTEEDKAHFDPSLKTKIVAHGNGGGYKLDQHLWSKYAEAAKKTGVHYNIIGIRWGSGGTIRHAYAGIKAAEVVKSFAETYGLDVSTLHGIGFRYVLVTHLCKD